MLMIAHCLICPNYKYNKQSKGKLTKRINSVGRERLGDLIISLFMNTANFIQFSVPKAGFNILKYMHTLLSFP